MKILVTGSEGSLMQAVIPLLSESGHEVLGVDNFARYGVIEREREYEFVKGDLTDAAFTESLVKKADAVVQAAALIYGVGGFNRYCADILSKDVVLNQNVLQAMVNNGVKDIAYISSSMVYERCQRHPVEEDDVDNALTPSTDYGLSKLTNERLVQAFHKQYGLQYTIWRPFNIITPREKGEKEIGTSHVFADFIKTIILEKKNPMPILGDGEQIRCFTWIEDVARGIADNAFGNPKALNQAFNLGNPEPVSMKELAQIIFSEARKMGLLKTDESELKFETLEGFPNDVVKRIPSIKKAESQLGWKPTLKVRESVRHCISFLEEEKL